MNQVLVRPTCELHGFKRCIEKQRPDRAKLISYAKETKTESPFLDEHTVIVEPRKKNLSSAKGVHAWRVACPNMRWYPQCRETRPRATAISSLWARREATPSLREIMWQRRTKSQVNKGKKKSLKKRHRLPRDSAGRDGGLEKNAPRAEMESRGYLKAELSGADRRSDGTPALRHGRRGRCKSTGVKPVSFLSLIMFVSTRFM